MTSLRTEWDRKQRRDAADALGISVAEVTALGKDVANARIVEIRRSQIEAEEKAQRAAWAKKKGAKRK